MDKPLNGGDKDWETKQSGKYVWNDVGKAKTNPLPNGWFGFIQFYLQLFLNSWLLWTRLDKQTVFEWIRPATKYFSTNDDTLHQKHDHKTTLVPMKASSLLGRSKLVGEVKAGSYSDSLHVIEICLDHGYYTKRQCWICIVDLFYWWARWEFTHVHMLELGIPLMLVNRNVICTIPVTIPHSSPSMGGICGMFTLNLMGGVTLPQAIPIVHPKTEGAMVPPVPQPVH